MSFGSDLDRFGGKLAKSAPEAVRAVALQALKMVTEETPVKTGRAKNNWFVNGGNPSNETTEQSSGAPFGVSVNMSKLLSEIGKITGKENNIYISNNLDYIAVLEHGSSKQAPSGMVKITVDKLRHHIESGKLKI